MYIVSPLLSLGIKWRQRKLNNFPKLIQPGEGGCALHHQAVQLQLQCFHPCTNFQGCCFGVCLVLFMHKQQEWFVQFYRSYYFTSLSTHCNSLLTVSSDQTSGVCSIVLQPMTFIQTKIINCHLENCQRPGPFTALCQFMLPHSPFPARRVSYPITD